MQVSGEPAIASKPIFLVELTQQAPVLPADRPASTKPLQGATPPPSPQSATAARKPKRAQATPQVVPSTVAVDTRPSERDSSTQAVTSSVNTTPGSTLPTAPNRGESVSSTAPTALAPPTIKLPSSNADYLNNPTPVYPAISQRLGEQGKVVIRVLITRDGIARQGEIHQSSGFDRLDKAAMQAVMSWRYVPGQRAGEPQDMWFNVPVNFNLN